MKPSEFISDVKNIPTEAIQPSTNNPRGSVQRDESFERLVASIGRVGILVPLVVAELSRPRSGVRYQLVDGERRFRAAIELGKKVVPAHVLHGNVVPRQMRMLMFHLHMTREQWGAMAQCRSLVDAYPELRPGLTFEEKPDWVRRLTEEAGMPSVTARDRVHVLSWPEELKDQFFRFDEEQPKRNIYSYILALEASIIEPSRAVFPEFYDGHRTADQAANQFRGTLLTKTIDGIETGALHSREQIRAVSPLFSEALTPKQKKIALTLFSDFIAGRETQFEDVRAEITTQLPEVLEEKPPKPQRVIASVIALTHTLENYQTSFIEGSASTEPKRRKLRADFADALGKLIKAASDLKGQV